MYCGSLLFSCYFILTVAPVTARLSANAAFVTPASSSSSSSSASSSSSSQATPTPIPILDAYAAELAEDHSTGSELTHLLSSLGFLTDLRAYVEKKPSLVYVRDADGWTMLHEAASHGHIKVVDYLVQKGADMNAETYFGTTALYLAETRLGQDSPMVQYLLAQGAISKEPNPLALQRQLRGNSAAALVANVQRHQL